MSDESPETTGSRVRVQRVVRALARTTVASLIIASWIAAAPGLGLAWLFEAVAEKLEVWLAETESRK